MRSPTRRTRAAIFGSGVLLLLAAAYAFRPIQPPPFQTVRDQYVPSEAYLLDRHGIVIDTERLGFGVRRLGWTELHEISPALINAIVDAEDRRFWLHRGVDWFGVMAAMKATVLGNQRRGASTLSMQLATLLTHVHPAAASRRTWGQKLSQMRMAYGLERSWSKQQILEGYLNLLQFRGELQGIGTVSQVLAHKVPAGLSESESRVLAALLPSPSASPERVSARACGRLPKQAAAVSCDEIREAAARLLTQPSGGTGGERLASQLGSRLLKHPGDTVRTTLDADVQREAMGALAKQLAVLSTRNVRDGAALVVDNATGSVLAYVGSGGPGSHAPYVDGVLALRQAGSTLKPFLYELALERRYLTAASILEDAPINLETGTGAYLPQDYDHDYKGKVTVRVALGGSLNVPAVRTLMLVGVGRFRDRLQQLGYTGISQDEEYYGYSLALGSADVTLWQQAQAYRTLARHGNYSPLVVLAQEPAPVSRTVLPMDASFIVGDILSDRTARAVTFGLSSSLSTGYWSAVKTGTSKDMRDNWCVGYTPRYTVAVWVGNFEGDPMQNVSGITGAAPAWREIMDSLQASGVAAPSPPPPGVHAAFVRSGPGMESQRKEWFLSGAQMAGTINTLDPNAVPPEIENPTEGMIVAIDPDIPTNRQKLPIRLLGGTEGLVVRVDEVIVGHAERLMLWQPLPGAHRIVLENASGEVVDQNRFTVR